ncbi:MAG: translocation/assembly module TamB domain-containing protein [Deltaproteobacteria bacterium]
MRRALAKWSGGSLLVLVLLVALVAGAGATLLGTDWGLEQVRSVGESVANDTLNGSVSIGAIEGSVFSQLTVRDVELFDAEGQPIARVARVFVDHDFSALFASRFHAKTIAIDAPWARLETYPDGSNNFARLVPPSPPEPETASAGAPQFTVQVDALTVDDGAFAMTQDTKTSTVVEGLLVRLGVEAPLPDVRAKIERIAASLPEQALEVELRADGGYVGGAAEVETLEIEVDEHRVLRVRDTHFDPSSLALDGRLAIDVPADLVRKVSRQPDLAVALVATATASHDAAAERWVVALDGRLNEAPLEVDAGLATDLSELAARVALTDVAPESIHPLAPAADVDLVATAKGPLDDLTLEASATIRDLAHPAVRVGEVKATATAQGLTGVLDAEADVRVRDVVVLQPNGRPAPIRAPRATLRVGVEGESLRAEVKTLEVITRDVTWSGGGTRVRIDGDTVRIDDLALTSNAGALTASGTIDTADPLRKSRDVRLDVDQLRLATFSRIVPGAPRLGGVVQMNARVDGTEASIAVQGADLSFEDVAPLALDLDVDLVDGVLTASVAADGAKLGRADVTARVTTPADPIDVAAWRRSPLDRVRAASAKLAAVDVEELGRILNVPTLKGGRVEGEIVAGPRVRRIDGTITLRDLRVAQLAAKVDADLTLLADDEQTAARLGLDLDGRRVADVDASLAVTVQTLERDGVAALEAGDGRVDLQLERLAVEEILAAVSTSTMAPTLTGVVTGAAKIDKRGADLFADVDLHADDLRLRPSAPIVDGRVTVDVDASRLEARLWIEGPKDLSVAAHARVTPPTPIVDAEAWQVNPFDRIETVTASVTGAQLEAIAELVGTPLPPGTLELGLRTGPGLADTQLAFELRDVDVSPQLSKLGAAAVVFERDGATLADVGLYVDERPIADIDVRLPRSVRALAATEPDAFAKLPLAVDVRSVPFDITHVFSAKKLRERFRGALAITAKVSGVVQAPKVDATLSVGDGTLGGRAFERLDLKAHVEGGSVDATLAARQDDGGRLDADVKLRDDVDATLVAQRFALDFVGELLQATAGTTLGFESSSLDAKVTASGELAEPDVNGDLTLHAKRLAVAPGVPDLEDAEVRVNIAGQDLDLTAKGTAGGGNVSATAKATVFPAEALRFEAKLKTDDVRVSAGTTAALATMDVRVKGRQEPDALRVDVTLDGGTITLPGDPGGGSLHPIDPMQDVVFVDRAGLAAARAAKRAAQGEKASNTIVRIATKRAIGVEGEQVRTALEMSLTMVTTPRGPAIDGWVSLPRGKLQLIAHEYDINRARVVFDGRVPMDPRLDVVLTKDFDNAVFSVIVTGTSKKPELNFVADPSVYTRGELMQVFLGGEPGVESGGEVTPEQAAAAAAGLLLGPVTQAIRRSLPIDTLKLDLGDEGKTPALTLGKWITDSLFVAYTFTVDTNSPTPSTTSEGLLRYRFTGTWVAELRYAQGQRGSADVIWVKRF